jgi:solute carrier family 25 protein 34/35
MVRTGFGCSVQLPTYSVAKRRLVKHARMEDGIPLHIMSSIIAGVVVCVVMHPLGILISLSIAI